MYISQISYQVNSDVLRQKVTQIEFVYSDSGIQSLLNSNSIQQPAIEIDTLVTVDTKLSRITLQMDFVPDL